MRPAGKYHPLVTFLGFLKVFSLTGPSCRTLTFLTCCCCLLQSAFASASCACLVLLCCAVCAFGTGCHLRSVALCVQQLADHFAELSMQKFSSNVVEKCLKLGGVVSLCNLCVAAGHTGTKGRWQGQGGTPRVFCLNNMEVFTEK